MNIHDINIALFHLINDFGKEFPGLNPLFVMLAEYTVFLLALGVMGFWLKQEKEDRIMVVCAVSAFLIAEVLGKGAGFIFSNKQPFAVLADVNQLIEKAVDNSFPSDHTILFFSITMTFFLFQKKSRWFWLGLACLVGISRVLVGVHYPADVIVGAGIAVISAFTVYKILPKFSGMHTLLAAIDHWEGVLFAFREKSRKHNDL